MGVHLSDDMMAAADDLYQGLIPRPWYRAAGWTAPPPSAGLVTFINDLAARAIHFEKLLTLVGRLKTH